MPASDEQRCSKAIVHGPHEYDTGAWGVKNCPGIEAEHAPPVQDKYALSSWGASAYEDLHLPSGQLCLVKRVGIEGLLQAGVIHDIDPLQKLVREHEDRVQGKDAPDANQQMMEILKDDTQIASLIHLLNRVLCYVVEKPNVQMAPNDVTKRVDGVVYTDSVELEDKLYILTWTIGGAEKVAQFRKEYEESLGGLQSEPEDGSPTQ